MLHHAAESLIDLCKSEGAIEWHARAERGYAPQYTFGEAAVRLVRAAAEMGDDMSVMAATTTENPSIAVWWRESLIFVAPCADRVELASLTARHLSQGA